MAILDRLLPAWRHSEAEVRAAAVRELDPDQTDVFASLARSDEDVRVRREAMKRVADPATLLELAHHDASEDLRAFAFSRASDLFVARAISDAPVEDCLRALEPLSRPSHFVAVAARAHHPDVRRAALARLTEPTALAEIARRSPDPDTAMEAMRRVDDAALLRRIASGNALVDVALAALERIDDPDELHAIVQERQTQKAVRKRARARLDQVIDDDHPLRAAERSAERRQLLAAIEALGDASDPEAAAEMVRALQARWRDLDTHGEAEAEDEQRFQRACELAFGRIAWALRRSAGDDTDDLTHRLALDERRRICERVETMSGPETPAQLDEARKAWKALGAAADAESIELAARFEAAVQRCEGRHERWRSRDAFRSRLASLVGEAEKLVGAKKDPRAIEKAHAALEKRWAGIAASPAAEKWMADAHDLQQRFAAAGAALAERLRSHAEERGRREQQARDRAVALCERLESFARAESVKTSSAERAIASVDATLASLREVHGPQRNELRQRLEAARAELIRRVSSEMTAEEWKRWANADAQRQLIERAEELLASDDPARMFAEVGTLDQDWKRFAAAPRKESRALWDRFRTARNELRKRCDAYLADNQARKEALCEAAERLADSTDWNATADEFRRLQAEWKTVGPVRRRVGDALFQRFREPANAFFKRREVVVSERRERFQEKLAKIEALRDAAVALADSSDWETAADEIKRLQAAWRDLSPRGGEAVQTVANEFKDACNRFFERYRRRDDIEAQAKLAEVETIVANLETLQAEASAAEAPAPQDVAQRLQEGLAAWGRRGRVPAAEAKRLEARVQAACEAIETACPEDLEDAGFDLGTTIAQREKICAKLEKLSESFAARAAEPEELDLGERLRLAMAANTIGGSAAPPREQALRDDVAAAEKLREKWQRLAPIVGKSARALVPRFEAAWARFDELRRSHAMAPASRSQETS